MAHFITALVAKVPIEQALAERYGLPVFENEGFAVIALNESHLFGWAQKFGFSMKAGSSIELDCEMAHHFAKLIGAEIYAIVRTQYFGGQGTQFAGVYSKGVPKMPVEEGRGVINRALKFIGVNAEGHFDEFEAVGLDMHRSFDRHFVVNSTDM